MFMQKASFLKFIANMYVKHGPSQNVDFRSEMRGKGKAS